MKGMCLEFEDYFDMCVELVEVIGYGWDGEVWLLGENGCIGVGDDGCIGVGIVGIGGDDLLEEFGVEVLD